MAANKSPDNKLSANVRMKEETCTTILSKNLSRLSGRIINECLARSYKDYKDGTDMEWASERRKLEEILDFTASAFLEDNGISSYLSNEGNDTLWHGEPSTSCPKIKMCEYL